MKTSNGRFVGFHARNLEVAELSEEAWASLQSSKNSEALEQIKGWEAETLLSDPDAKSILNIKSITLNVTQICNLHCNYCAAGGDGSFGDPVRKISIEKTLPQLKFLLTRLQKGETFQITYLGGEPLLYAEGIRLLGAYLNHEAKDLDLQIKHRLVTNGTIYNQDIENLLVELNMNVTVSLDGTSEVNDARRPMKNGKSSTAVASDTLKKLEGIKDKLSGLSISGVFGKDNMDLSSAYKFFSEFNVDHYEFNLDHTDLTMESAKTYSNELARMLEIASTSGEESFRKIGFVNKIFSNLDNQTPVKNYCGAGKSFVMIDAKNNIYPCVWSPNKSSEMIGTGQTLFQTKLVEFEKPLVEKQGCNTCWARFLCGGGCMFVHEQATGSKHIPAEIFCFQSRSLISNVIMYYQQFRALEV